MDALRRDRRVAFSSGFVGELRPTAMPMTGAGIVEPREGWLYCNGASLSRATYKRLFDAIGTTYGSADGSSFNLPDYRGRALSFALDGQAAGGTRMAATAGTPAGVETHALTKAELAKHVHDKGSLTITNGGDHTHPHDLSIQLADDNNGHFDPGNAIYVESGWTGGGSTQAFDSLLGTSGSSEHTHPSGDFSGVTENGAAAGLAAGAHSNVPPLQGVAFMVRY